MKKLWTFGILAAVHAVMASESFGGLGLAIYPSGRGAEVAHVVQGASAHLAGIETGDFLLSANGVSLSGKSLDFDMDVLRGNPEETVELTVLRNSDTLRISVRREAIVVKNSADEDCSGIAFKAMSDESLQFLDAVELPNLNASVYAKISESSDLVSPFRKEAGSLSLSIFDRNSIQFELENSGPAKLEIFSAQGQKVETFQMNGSAGTNLLAWNGNGLSSGSYFVQVSQNGKTLSYKGVLR